MNLRSASTAASIAIGSTARRSSRAIATLTRDEQTTFAQMAAMHGRAGQVDVRLDQGSKSIAE